MASFNNQQQVINKESQPTTKRRAKLVDANCCGEIYKYPYIDKTAFSDTMSAYKSYVDKYNENVKIYNNDVVKYNRIVANANAKSKSQDVANEVLIFNKKHNALFAKNYNELILEHNEKSTIKLPKRKAITIKWASELYFAAILKFYASQMRRNNQRLLSNNLNTTRPLEKVRINSYELSRALRGDDTKMNLAHHKTFQRHIKRLTEADVLTGYEFINSKKPIFAFINTEILTVLDHQPEKIQNTGNQFFISTPTTKRTELSDTITRTFINKNKIKAETQKVSAELESDVGIANDHSNGIENDKANELYKNTEEIVTENSNRQKNQAKKTRATIETTQAHANSARFREGIINIYRFAEKLTANEYEFYKPIPISEIYQEVKLGLLDKSEFRTVILQELVKKTAKMWSKSEKVSVGSWVNALKIIDAEWFMTFNGYEFDKVTIYNRLQEYNYRINRAIKFVRENTDFNILYPSLYFNSSRKTSYEGGFAFTSQWWSSYLSAKGTTDQNKRINTKEHKARKTFANQKKRMETRVHKVVNGTMTMAQLYAYLDTNGFKKEVIDLVPDTITKIENY